MEESPEGGYEAQASGYSIFSEADPMDELKEAVRDAILCHFRDEDTPKVVRLHLINDEVMPA